MNEQRSEKLLGELQRGSVYFLEKDFHDSVYETMLKLRTKESISDSTKID